MTDGLGDLQQVVMLAALRLGPRAYGAGIQNELEEQARRTVSISTIYVTMDRLERRGFVRSWLGDATPVRGGKPKRFYAVTEAGHRALARAREDLERMWKGVTAPPAPSRGR